MNERLWKPNVTVAAMVERDGKFLLVEEDTERGRRFNQPAGHLEPGESLIEAVVRETLEETAYKFTPRALLGAHLYPHRDITYLRFTFIGDVSDHDATRKLDAGILRADWFTLDEIRTLREQHRTAIVMRVIEDYIAGKHFPLETLNWIPSW